MFSIEFMVSEGDLFVYERLPLLCSLNEDYFCHGIRFFGKTRA